LFVANFWRKIDSVKHAKTFSFSFFASLCCLSSNFNYLSWKRGIKSDKKKVLLCLFNWEHCLWGQSPHKCFVSRQDKENSLINIICKILFIIKYFLKPVQKCQNFIGLYLTFQSTLESITFFLLSIISNNTE
jgi:hypothetical protein